MRLCAGQNLWWRGVLLFTVRLQHKPAGQSAHVQEAAIQDSAPLRHQPHPQRLGAHHPHGGGLPVLRRQQPGHGHTQLGACCLPGWGRHQAAACSFCASIAAYQGHHLQAAAAPEAGQAARHDNFHPLQCGALWSTGKQVPRLFSIQNDCR